MKPIIAITMFGIESACPRSAVNQAYVEAVVDAGGVPLCVPLGVHEDGLADLFALCDGLLLPGGDDVDPAEYGRKPHFGLGPVDRERDRVELWLTRQALRDDMPVLGICRGIQVLAVAAGGSLYQDLPSEHPSPVAHEVRSMGRDYLSHTIEIEPQSHLARAVRRKAMGVNSFHHQAVLDVPPGFVVSARAEDGVIEGIEAPDKRYAVGVQCHPEEIRQSSGPEFNQLFEQFVDAVRIRKAVA